MDNGENYKAHHSKPYYMVLDFEANCSGQDIKDHEIIEFPAILVNAVTMETISEFRYFVRVSSGKKLSNFIKQLTHITQDQVDKGLTFFECLQKFEQWCKSNNVSWANTTIITVGDWDLKIMLHNQLGMTKIKLGKYLNDLFGCWTNIKVPFSIYTKTKAKGMAGMMAYLNLELEGHQHSGIDDCRNTVKICNELIKMGCDVTKPTQFRHIKFWYYEHKLPYKFNENSIVKC